MKVRKLAEWEDHDQEPGGDVGFLLEAVEYAQGHPRYMWVSWSVLTDEEFYAFDRGEEVNLEDLSRVVPSQ